MARLGQTGGAGPGLIRDAVTIGLATRAFIVVVAIVSALALDTSGSGNRAKFDVPALTHPFHERALDHAFSPLARWDSVWYLDIARSGYGNGLRPGRLKPAFFPLYPLLVRGAAGLSRSPKALLVAAYVVSLAAFLAALVLLGRLVALELGARFARPVILLTALFPASLFFGIPYSESIFLALSVGAFYAARTERWAWAAAAVAAASATRVTGIVLLAPLALFYLYGPRKTDPDRPAHGWWPRYRPRADLAWLALAPLGIVLYSVHLGAAHGDALAYFRLQDVWDRQLTLPVVGAVKGWHSALNGAGLFFDKLTGRPLDQPLRAGWANLVDFGFLVFVIAGVVGTFRRLPFPYGAYCLLAIMLPLSSPRHSEPLYSFPRFAAVLFPIFMWLAVFAEERRLTLPLAVASSLLLAVFTQQFATWEFFA